MKRNLSYLIGIYSFTIFLMNLFLILIIGGIINAFFVCSGLPIFTLEDWLCSYLIGYIILYIFNMDIFINLYEENKNV